METPTDPGSLKQLVKWDLASWRLGRCPELAEDPDALASSCRARGSGEVSALAEVTQATRHGVTKAADISRQGPSQGILAG